MAEPLTFPFSTPPEHGTAVLVAPRVWWVRMPLPFQLNHINLWLLEDGDGWVMIDTGIASKLTMELWEKVFSSVLGDRPVRRLIVTHFHPDHFGLAGWLAKRWNIDIEMSATEWAVGQLLSRGPTEASRLRQREHEYHCGYTEEINASIADKNNYHERVSALPELNHVLKEGDRLTIAGRKWQVIVGEGHSPEHVCLWNEQDSILIAGDQVLAKISPNISVWASNPEANPLELFLASMEKLRALPAKTLVLPSHGLPFYGLHARLDELTHHHDERLELALKACATPMTVKALVPVLFSTRLLPDQIPFAVGETLAHLNYLLALNKLTRAIRQGVWYFESGPCQKQKRQPR